MKTFFRILTILVVATIVASLFYGIVTTFSSGTNQSEFSERHVPGDGDFTPPNRDRESDGLSFPIDLIKNFIIITIVCTGYLLAKKFLSKKYLLPTLSI